MRGKHLARSTATRRHLAAEQQPPNYMISNCATYIIPIMCTAALLHNLNYVLRLRTKSKDPPWNPKTTQDTQIGLSIADFWEIAPKNISVACMACMWRKWHANISSLDVLTKDHLENDYFYDTIKCLSKYDTHNIMHIYALCSKPDILAGLLITNDVDHLLIENKSNM